MEIKEIEKLLTSRNIQYEVIQQDKPILSALDAEGYYPVEKSAPTFVLQTENGLIGCMAVSYTHLFCIKYIILTI